VDVHRQTAHSDDPDTQSETADRDPRGQRHDRKRYASLLGAAACTRGATLSRRRLPSSSESLPTRAMASGPGSGCTSSSRPAVRRCRCRCTRWTCGVCCGSPVPRRPSRWCSSGRRAGPRQRSRRGRSSSCASQVCESFVERGQRAARLRSQHGRGPVGTGRKLRLARHVAVQPHDLELPDRLQRRLRCHFSCLQPRVLER